MGQKRKSFPLSGMSGLPPEADITPASPRSAGQLTQISEVICLSAGALREQHAPGSSSRKVRA